MEKKGLLGINFKRTTPVKMNYLPSKYYSNNWLKMHNKPMRRKPLRRQNLSVLIMGQTGYGHSYIEKMIASQGEEYKRFNSKLKYGQ